jgi:membrane-bound lytic murein transglycosylase A
LSLRGQVHQTMSAAIARASAISRTITHIAVILLAAACTSVPQPPGPERARYVETAFSDLPGWREAVLEPSLRAFVAGCPRLSDALARICAAAPAPFDEVAARGFFEARFTAYAVVSSLGAESNLITGYFEPIIEGSRAPSALHRHPIYGLPDDLVVVDLAAVSPELRNLRLRGRLDGRRVVPYYSRAEIEARGSGLPAKVIAWTADPVELFFVHVQGSGQVQLDNGQRIRIGYADQNGHPYRSLGRHLIERGEMTLEQASMQGIQEWAAANPQKLREVLNANPSYVFFRELEPLEAGPIGALGVPLTAQYSLAVDRRFVPLGSPVYLASTWPLSEQRLERLMAAQDVGGAIRGVARGDFYWGTGKEAGALAGRMRQQGRMWLLWPKGEPLPPGS